MPKPAHLTWEEAAGPGLVNSTAYRQLVSRNGAGHEAGRHRADLGRLAAASAPTPRRWRSNGGATPVCVVSSPEKAEICRRMGAELVIDRSAEGYRFWKDEHTQDPQGVAAVRRRGSASSPAATTPTSSSSTRAGRRSAPASTSPAGAARSSPAPRPAGFLHEYDNRYLWMNLKRIIGSHFANYREAWEANRLVAGGRSTRRCPGRTRCEDVGQAALRRPPQPAPGQGRRALPGARGGPRGARPGAAGPARTAINRFRDV